MTGELTALLAQRAPSQCLASWRAALSRWNWLAGSAGGAVLYTLACPPYEWSLAAWVIPALFLLPVRGLGLVHAFWAGVLFGVLSSSGITAWAFHASLQYFGFNRLLAGAFVALVWVLFAGIPFGLLAATYAAASRRVTGPARVLVAASLWVGSELLRATAFFGGMPWELLGHTQFNNLLLIQVADLGGVYAVSFVVVLVSVGAAELLIEAHREQFPPGLLLRGGVLPAGLLAAVLLYGLHSRALYDVASPGEALKVAVVQGNVPNAFRWKREYAERNLATYMQLTHAMRSLAPDLIIWPENAVEFYINRDHALRSKLREVAGLARDGLVVGGPRLEGAMQAYNSAYLIGPEGGIDGFYDKRRLVPFAEYNPIASSTRWNEPVYVPGTKPEVLRAAGANIGTLICYEVLFPRLVSDLVRNGAGLLVNLSNDSWLDRGDGAAPRQHFSMAVFRTVETRRSLVRASASGVSGFINPYGHMYAVIPSDTTGTALDTVVVRHEQTPYVRWGDGWIVASVALAAVLVVRGQSAEVCS